ncbi:gliding motility-associated-like protein [Mucilaginibacter gracilis]|uniref:Gliding motility-associated-like protein n=1 Tax=Mucilaginibacter gracilis TaxID=423350 RepID=A0A495IZY4_9SPHI|nr:DUF2341 domain-containing protein [Mucilaginibacter gracilis]RKR82285.1 gliding motility-associated-like protein [Mucilaginibacter gracilis]
MNKYLLFIVLCFSPFLLKGQCLTGWLYKAPITVSNSNGSALADFQVSITLNTQALISAGKMNAAGNDIRFVDGSCTNLPYWIESGINTANTIIWVKVNSVPANGTNTIYCYYGNSAAAAATDGNATFMLFDDFDGGTLDASKWTAYGSPYSISGGSISFQASSASSVVRSNASLPGPYVSEIKANSTSGNWPSLAQVNSGTFSGSALFQGGTTMYLGVILASGSDYAGNFSSSTNLGNTTGLWSLVTIDATHQNGSWPGGALANINLAQAPSATIQTAFGCLETGTGTMSVDWFRARQYAAQTPTFTVAAEQVNKLPQTITFTALPTNKVYGNPDFDPGATSTNNTIPVTYTSSNTAAVTIVSGKLHIVGAGTATITASQAGDNTYLAATDVQQTITIAQAPLTIIASNATKVYGDALPALAVTYSGFVNGETSAVLTTAPAITTTGTASSAVGTYPITATGAVASNYTITYTAGSLTVTPAGLNITAVNQTKIYGAANPTLTATYSGFVNGDTNSSLTTQPTITTTAVTGSQVNTYPITATGAASPNYTISYTAGTLTVTKAGLTITASNATKVYGAVLPTLAVTYSGFVNSETSGVLTTQPTITTTGTASSAVGTYPITAAGAASANYNITYTAGSLTVTKAGLNITAVNQTKVYGAANPTLAVTYSGFVNSDDATKLTTQPTIATTATASSAVGTYPITATGAASANYSISYTAATLTVTQAPLVITANNISRNYGQPNPTLTVTYTGLVNGDTNNSLSTQPTITTTATITSLPGTYPITASGAVGPNYSISYVAGTFRVIPLTNANLSNLTISNGILSPTFATGTFSYTTSVANSVSNVTVIPTADPTATVLVNGLPATNGGPFAVDLSVGNNTITVLVTAQDGTTKLTYTIALYRAVPPDAVFATNILTPNGDGKNDNWIIKDILLYPNNTVKVFDRAGRIVFAQHSYANTWDGTLSGSPLTEGTYYYAIDLGIFGAQPIKGYVSILRKR